MPGIVVTVAVYKLLAKNVFIENERTTERASECEERKQHQMGYSGNQIAAEKNRREMLRRCMHS